MSRPRRTEHGGLRLRAWPWLVLLLLLPACSTNERAERATSTAGSDSLDLWSATYLGISEAGGPVTLTEGRWTGAPLEPGAATRSSVVLVRTLTPQGNLDGDGEPESVAFLAASAGGTGSQLYAAVIARRDGRWRNVATAVVGDRVELRDARIEARRLVLEVVQAGAEDALCCPGELATRAWELIGDSLTEQPVQVTGRLGPAVLEGSEWVLRAWSHDEPASPEPEVTLLAADGRWAGKSACNRYTVSVEAGEMPGEVRLGPAVSTRMACIEPAASIEARYLKALESVTRFQFLGGQLALAYEYDGASGMLLLERRRAVP